VSETLCQGGRLQAAKTEEGPPPCTLFFLSTLSFSFSHFEEWETPGGTSTEAPVIWGFFPAVVPVS